MYPDNCTLSCKERKMVDLCLLQAKRCALCWKNVGCPSFNHWLNNLTLSLAFEKLTYIVKKRASELYNIWKLFLELLRSGDMGEALGE